ncbi:MAG: phosphopantothenoylcysteine decarboxylase, partial [Proteobacteria bacterium]|nr:phosphopantothenoylcysteine decarboxylase [Pseudomonadota bacterium]
MPHEIIVGVTGGIAAYKTASLVSGLVQDGYHVSVVMTRSARKFVGPATFRALTGRPVS